MRELCKICAPEQRGRWLFDEPRHGAEDRRPMLGGVRLAAEVGFMAPNHGLRLWLAAAESIHGDDGPCCAEDRIELTLIDMIENHMYRMHDSERHTETRELAEYLRHIAGWLERGAHARW